MAQRSSPTATAIDDWLTLERDVLVLGDDGSGRSTVLREIVTASKERGAHTVFVSSSRSPTPSPLAPLLMHDLSTAKQASSQPEASELVRRFSAELEGRQNLVIVDDLDALDIESLAIIDEVLRRTGARLVASAPRDLGREPDIESAPIRALLGERAPAEVIVGPLGFTQIASLLTKRLGAAPDSAVIAAIATQSAGNPRVAIALADAARWCGAFELRDGVWTQTQCLEGVPLATVARTMTSRLSAPATEALELLACAGPLSAAAAERLVGARMVEHLADRERIVSGSIVNGGSATGTSLSVSPPALARALRDRVTGYRRHALTQRIAEAVGDDLARPAEPPRGIVDLILSDREDDASDLVTQAAQLTSLIDERTTADVSARLTLWRAAPTAKHAVALLDSIARGPGTEHHESVFHNTCVTDDEPETVRADFEVHRLHWQPGRGECSPLPDELSAQWSTLHRSQLLLEEGKPEAALELLTEHPHCREPRPADRYLEGARTDALLLLARLDEAERWSRGQLEWAFERLDPIGVRMHGLGLVQCLFLSGQNGAAWRAADTVLRLGRPGPFDMGYCRLLAIGAVLSAQRGDLEVARALHRELERHPLSYRPVLGSLREWASAHMLYASGDAQQADDMLWQQGLSDAQKGFHISAMFCWGTRVGPYTEDQMAQIRSATDGTSAPLFDDYFALHDAMASRCPTAIAETIGEAPLGVIPLLASSAISTLEECRQEAGAPPLTVAELEQLIGGALDAAQLLRTNRATDDEALSHREYQIALLARAGMPNREIAQRLFLSVRTIENHMYRALRKLGLASRADLQAGWRP